MSNEDVDLPPLTETQKRTIRQIVVTNTSQKPLMPGEKANPIDKLLGDMFADTLDESQKDN